MNKTSDFSYYLSKYLTTYIAGIRNLSINTQKSYRDTFKILIIFFNSKYNLSTHKIELKHLTKETICEFIIWLKETRSLGNSSLNQRLACIHAFFKYLQNEAPEKIYDCQKIMSIPYRRCLQKTIDYLTKDALKSIFDVIDKSKINERRDLVMLCVLYDTGARVQELCDLSIRDLHIHSDSPYIMLTGKGNKSRYVPIMKNTKNILIDYLKEQKLNLNEYYTKEYPVFFNRQNNRLTRSGISYIINKYANRARLNSNIIPEKVTPHIFRHSKAMHLCQAGVDLIYIRDILGHVNIETTQVYARINIETIRDSLEKVYPDLSDSNLGDWTTDKSLMDFLESL